MIKKYIIPTCLLSSLLCIFTLPVFAQDEQDENELGQTIQIYTHLHSFVGTPTWLLIIRDLDHDQNIPYLFDIKRGDNFWVAFTYGRNYLITVSRLEISTYKSRTNSFRNFRMNDFCNLQSNGHIMRGESMSITINGDLFPNSDSYSCNASTYIDPHFTIVKPNSEE